MVSPMKNKQQAQPGVPGKGSTWEEDEILSLNQVSNVG